ncbi:MAG: CARDB domain-containing protein, partial [Anaerolineaceae bacterium]
EGNYAYTNDDGDNWNPIGGGPPNGADHETVGTGPLPASLSLSTTPLNQGQYAIFCSQTLVGANCERSFDLGTTYTNPVVATGPGAANSQGCGGLHGHVRIGPDGTGYLPDNSCGGVQGGALTVDGGTLPWSEFQVKKTVADADGPAFTTASQSNGADPSIGIDKANTLYYCYVNNESNGTEGHVHCAVGKRNDPANPTKINWIRDTDVGITHGIVNAAHTETIAGDAGRAACGFFGTNVKGNYQAGSFTGVWYAFIATTYDEGRTWVTVNATPNDPVQRMTGIWQQGGGGEDGDRNLLDFNEVTMDDHGRVLYGYSDGCTSTACIGGTTKSNLGASMRVARQIGGKSLLAAFDSSTDTTAARAPKAACLSGTRDLNGSHLMWKVPDNGGADITSYQILRGLTAGNEAPIATYYVGPGSKAEFTDAPVSATNPNGSDPTVAHYFYKIIAVNPVNAGPLSNEVDLTVIIPPAPQSPCTAPGVTVLTDAVGDSLSPEPGTDMLSASIAQPYVTDGNLKLVFTLKTDPAATAAQPIGSAWYLAMKVPGATAGSFRYTGVRMEYNSTTPNGGFYYYTPGSNSSGGVDGRFVDAETQTPGTYDPTTGTITITVNASDVGLAEGSSVLGFVAGSAQTTDPTNGIAGATEVYDPMPDSLAFAGGYTVAANSACAPNTAPTAALAATSSTSGTAPLTVGFTGAGSRDPDAGDNIASYIFNYGDASSPGTETKTTPTASHTYNAAGNYTASLTVKDSHGASSTNIASVAVAVAAPKPDLIVSVPTSSNNQAKQGDKITFTATVTNAGQGSAGASATEFRLDGNTVLGTPATVALAPGVPTQVSVQWQTTAKTAKGNHTIVATADKNAQVAESDETNNAKSLIFYLQGNKTR